METAIHDDLFSSLISDIKSYTGNDPLLPWLRGIRKMRESLPPELLNEKLPRFLQKCAQTFESDRRYRNDLRFIRIWIQLMDYVDDPKALLRTMEMKRLGTKHSLFYQAYALYYEKMKKFEEADRMYRLGVQK
uniref:BUB1 N-terminal domain-containing protein n=1 Tax=Opuntia streptacantha TaxID=393608 RepID=A0A7C9FQU5_OPUST